MAEQTQLISHWYHYVSGAAQSAQALYSSIEAAVTARQLPDVRFSRVDYKEGGLLSAKREYLRIRRNDLSFEVCGAPFGNGFFVSARMFVEATGIDTFLGGMFGHGAAGGLAKAMANPDTFYKQDTALMYQQLVHGAILEVVDAMTDAAKLPRIAEAERRPIMRGFYQ